MATEILNVFAAYYICAMNTNHLLHHITIWMRELVDILATFSDRRITAFDSKCWRKIVSSAFPTKNTRVTIVSCQTAGVYLNQEQIRAIIRHGKLSSFGHISISMRDNSSWIGSNGRQMRSRERVQRRNRGWKTRNVQRLLTRYLL